MSPMQNKPKLQDYYIERTDVSYCVVRASSPEEAEIISGDGNTDPDSYVHFWNTEVGELEIRLDKE